jgi:hypothetical protein
MVVKEINDTIGGNIPEIISIFRMFDNGYCLEP